MSKTTTNADVLAAWKNGEIAKNTDTGVFTDGKSLFRTVDGFNVRIGRTLRNGIKFRQGIAHLTRHMTRLDIQDKTIKTTLKTATAAAEYADVVQTP